MFHPISDIIIRDRQRKEFAPKQLQELKTGILSKGLLHPIVLSSEADGTKRLRAGERRLRAITALHEEGHDIFHNGLLVPKDQIPYTLASELDEADLQELELEENLLRVDLTWMEENEARVRLHDLRTSQNPAQTKAETGKEIAAVRGTSPQYEAKSLARAQLIVKNKDLPAVAKAKNEAVAFKAIMDRSEQGYHALLQEMKLKHDSPHKIMHGDCRTLMADIAPGSIATIICDPPYGIEADKAGQQSKHYYDDSAKYALEICEFIIREGFHKTKPRATMFMFCAIEHFTHLRDYAKQHAWSVFKTPLVWFKDQGGNAPWGKAGFQRSYELIMFATKGGDELVTPGGLDVLTFKPSSKTEKTHAAGKPTELLARLARLSTLPGEIIMDPCAGSGSIIPAADTIGCRTICFEQDEAYYQQCLNRLNPAGTDEDAALDELALLDATPDQGADE